MRLRRRRTYVTLVTSTLVLVLVLAGVVFREHDGRSGDARTTSATDPDAGSFFGGRTARWRRPAKLQPNVPIPTSIPPPRALTTTRLRSGRGQPVRNGDTAVINYVGAIYKTGRVHDTSYGENGLPLEVVPGSGSLIPGFERGVVGMRVGERRRVIVPPRLAYGNNGYSLSLRSSRVPPGATLVYVIDLEAVRRPQRTDSSSLEQRP